MKKNNLVIGRLGEEIAKEYLESKGYKIIEQNYRSRYAEIDLVTLDRKVVVFVEVRSRINDFFGLPEETFTKKKINKVVNNALMYMAFKKWDYSFRIDALSVIFSKDIQLQTIRHYPNITLE